MADDNLPPERVDEQSPLQFTESSKRTWRDVCGFASVGILVAGLILRFILKARVSEFTFHVVLLSVFFVGTIASGISLFTGDALSRERQKKHRWAAIFNALLFVISGYVTFLLLQLGNR